MEPPDLGVRNEAILSKVSIGEYMKVIDGLLDDDRVVEAAAHCRHILESYPRHIDTYRLLGKALLEQQKYDDAGDVLQRILSADPEDFIAHVGLAIVHKEEERLADAVWHMERAFEMDPYNAAIQEELRGLYIARDGEAPERIALSQGALARLYARGNLFQQAAAELRQAVESDPARVDLQILLAEVLWRDGQRVEAMERSLKVLEQLPYCIKANAIVAEVWQAGGRSDEARRYYHNLTALTALDQSVVDSETAVGRAYAVDGAPALPATLSIEQLAYEARLEPTESFSMEDTPDWVQELGELEEAATAEAEQEHDDDDDVLDWLRDAAVGDELAADYGDVAIDETPDWLLAATDEESSQSSEQEEVTDETPEWMVESERPEASVAAEEDDTPEWLADLAAGVEEMGRSEEADAAESDEGPAWLSEISAETMAEATPDWLDVDDEAGVAEDLIGEQVPAEAEAQSDDDGDEETPAWLLELDDGDDETPAPDWLAAIEAEAAEEAAQVPAWLQEEVTDESAPTMQEPPDIATDDLDDWLGGEASEEMPDWLAQLDETTESELPAVDSAVAGAVAPEAMEKAMQADVDEPEIGDPASPDDEDLEDALAWLEELAAQDETSDDDEKADLLADVMAGEEEKLPAEDIPDWLKADAPSAETMPEWLESDPSAEVELPDWLQEMDATASDPSALDEGSGLLPELTEESTPETAVEAEDWFEEFDDEPPVAATDGEDLSWLDQLATGESDVFEEPPTLTWEAAQAEETAAPVEPASSDIDEPLAPADLPAWLAELAPDDAPAIRAETPDVSELSDEMPEDPEEARRWLDALAASRGTLDLLEGKVTEEPAIDADEPEWPVAATAEIDDSLADVPDDPDEAMAWLEQLAARQGAPVDELPSIIDDEASADEVGETVEAASPVSEVAPAPEIEESEPALSLSDEPDVMGGDEVPEDLDAAMAWLEQLAAQQGAPLDELPSVERPLEEQAFVGDEVEEAPEIEAAEESVAFEAPTEEPALEEPVATEDIAAGISDVPEDLDEAMAWLEQLAAQQGAPLDELPTVDELPALDEQPPQDVAPTAPAAGEHDAGELVSDVAEPEETLPAVTTEFEDETGPVEVAEAMTTSVDETEMAFDEGDVPEDLDDAMAWLETLAARQGAPIDELPSIGSADATPEAEGEATAIEPPDALSAEVDMVAPIEADEPAQMTSFDDIPAELSDDPDEMMAWLEQMAVEQGAPETDLQPTSLETDEAAPEREAVADFSGEELDLMPDDPDEAIAWLEQLAAQDEVPDASLSTATPTDAAPAFTVDADDGIPDWLRAEVTDDYGEPPDEGAEEDTAVEESVTAETAEELEAEEETAVAEPAALAEPEDESVAEDALDMAFSEQNVADSLPDWLDLESESDDAEPAWTEVGDGTGVTGWLAAEEEMGGESVTTPELSEDEPDYADQAAAPVAEVADVDGPAVPATVEPETQPDMAPVAGNAFQSARRALGEGRWDEARAEYEKMLAEGDDAGALIAELESVMSQHPQRPLLRRLLGDAYMQNGQLQKALDSYRQALDYL